MRNTTAADKTDKIAITLPSINITKNREVVISLILVMSLMVLASVSASSFIQTARSQIIVHCPNGLQYVLLMNNLKEIVLSNDKKIFQF